MTEVDIYTVPLEADAARLDSLYEVLAPEGARARHEIPLCRASPPVYPVLQGVLREMLSPYVELHPARIAFVYNRSWQAVLARFPTRFQRAVQRFAFGRLGSSGGDTNERGRNRHRAHRSARCPRADSGALLFAARSGSASRASRRTGRPRRSSAAGRARKPTLRPAEWGWHCRSTVSMFRSVQAIRQCCCGAIGPTGALAGMLTFRPAMPRR